MPPHGTRGPGPAPVIGWPRLTVLLAAAALLDANAAGAQLRAGVDAELATRYVWRGVSRTTRPVVQGQGYLYLPHGGGGWMAGGWVGLEPWSARTGQPTVAGLDGPGWNEWNAWVQRDFRGGGNLASVGAAAYVFRGEAAGGGLSDSVSTAELYARLSIFEGIRVVTPTLVAAWDFWRVDGVYLELQLHRRVPFLPVGPLRMLELGATTGFSLGQRRTAEDPGYFARNSFTALDLSLGMSPRFHLGSTPLTTFATGHWQIGFDRATRPVSDGERKRSTLWLELGLSLTPANGARERE